MNFKIMLLLTGISVAVFVVSATISLPLPTASAQTISLPLPTESAQSTNTANSCSGDVGNDNDCRQQGSQQGDRNTQDNTFRNEVTSIDATIDINLQ
jgi:hypothetical protein